MANMAVHLSVFVLVGTMLLVIVCATQLPSSESGYLNEENNETYGINCDKHSDSDCSSKSLEDIAKILETDYVFHRKYIININTTQLHLKRNITFNGVEALTISGGTDLNTKIICQGIFPGLMFISVDTLKLSNLTVVNCGATIHNYSEFTYSSAVVLTHSKDVRVKNLIIMKSQGIGLTILHQQGGFIQIKSSMFIENRLQVNDSNILGGGGVYVGGETTEPTTFLFDNCTFQDNLAHTRYYRYIFNDDFGQPIDGHGLGGGAAILLIGMLADVHIKFTGCIFTGNVAYKGGGLAIEIVGHKQLQATNMSVVIEHCLFEGNGRNSVNSTVVGGGLQVQMKRSNTTNFALQNVTFKNNTAQYGGGIYFFSNCKTVGTSNTFSVNHCVFEGNVAHTGSAVDITPDIFQGLSCRDQITPVFKDCLFFNNTVHIKYLSNNTQTTYGIATVYISFYSVKFEGYNNFTYNLGTAIHIVIGNIDMSQSNIYFYKNYGILGGAVALIGESSMIVGPNRSYTFLNNIALGKGGALYVEMNNNQDITASKKCFVQIFDGKSYNVPVSEWNATISFTGNRAKVGTGHAIFATSLYLCKTINVGTNQKSKLRSIDASEVFSARGISIEEDPELEGHQVATEGALLYHNKTLPIEVIPGERFAHGVSVLDDLNHTTKVVLTASVPISANPNVQLDTAFSSCVGEHIILKGKEGEESYLFLQTMSLRLAFIQLSVKLIRCPPGFLFSDKELVCVCNYHKYFGLVRCRTNIFYSYITPGVWAGLVEDANNRTRKELVTGFCPFNFCNYNRTETTSSVVRLPQSYDQLDEAMCGRTRNGTACGDCAQGYTMHFHSPNYACKPVDPTLCKVGWFFYIISELVPVTVIFITVIVLNISFTSGAVNGFILFSQLLLSLNIDASGFIKFSPVEASLTRGYQITYGFFNLDLLQVDDLSFCLWQNASALDMLAFKYVTIIYALFLVIILIYFMSKCHRMTRCFAKYCRFTTLKTSVIHGVSAFLILCYSQCLKVSLNLLCAYDLIVREGSDLIVSKRVWVNANILYLSRQHLLYAIPAMFCVLTIGILPPIVLLAYPLMNRVWAIIANYRNCESRLLNFISHQLSISTTKPLIDSFQGCFKDDLRFFAGLYFLYRWIALIQIFIISFSAFYTAVEVLLIVIFVLHTVCQPYAWRKHNIIDALLFADLALINAITFTRYYKFRTRGGRKVLADYFALSGVIQLILIYIPFLGMAVYTGVRICKFGCRQKRQSVSRVSTTSTYLRKLKDFVSSIRKNNNIDNEELPHRLIAEDIHYETY